jgi:hypothetical protein
MRRGLDVMNDRLKVYALIAEIVSAIAIVISLVFVGFQIQQSNRLSRAEAFRSPTSDINSINAAFMAIPSFRTGFKKVIDQESRMALEDGETIIVDSYLISLTNIYAQLSREIREGILPPGSLENFSGRELLRTPYYRESWPIIKTAFDPLYVKEYEAMGR